MSERPWTPYLTWVDLDGDRLRLRTEEIDEDPAVIASILVMDRDDGAEAEVYVDEIQARDLIEWLSSMLLVVEQRRLTPP